MTRLRLGPPHSHFQLTSVDDCSCAFRCPSYIPLHHGDLAKLNVFCISWAAMKSCNCSLLHSFQIQSEVVLNTAALSDIIRCGLVPRVISTFCFLWNSIAIWDLVTSRCTARRTAQVNISVYALPSSFLFIL